MTRLLQSSVFMISSESGHIVFDADLPPDGASQYGAFISTSSEYSMDRIYYYMPRRPYPIDTYVTVYNYEEQPIGVPVRRIDRLSRQTGVNWHRIMNGTLLPATTHGWTYYFNLAQPAPRRYAVTKRYIRDAISSDAPIDINMDAEVYLRSIEIAVPESAKVTVRLGALSHFFQSYAISAIRSVDSLYLIPYNPQQIDISQAQVRDDGVIAPYHSAVLLPKVSTNSNRIGFYSYYDNSYGFINSSHLDELAHALRVPIRQIARYGVYEGVSIINFEDANVVKSSFDTDIMSMQ